MHNSHFLTDVVLVANGVHTSEIILLAIAYYTHTCANEKHRTQILNISERSRPMKCRDGNSANIVSH